MGILVLALIVLTGLIGLFARQVCVRGVLWLLAVPPFLVGLLGLGQGGIAEPFTPKMMAVFCAFAFWPAFGCMIGEILKYWRKPAAADHPRAFPALPQAAEEPQNRPQSADVKRTG
jgi:hypothetical protein